MRVPVANRIGEENDGWTVAKYLLEFERGSAFASRIRGMMRQVKAIATAETSSGDGQALVDDAAFCRKFSDVEVALAAVDYTERRVISSLSTGRNAGDLVASMLKLKGTETMRTGHRNPRWKPLVTTPGPTSAVRWALARTKRLSVPTTPPP